MEIPSQIFFIRHIFFFLSFSLSLHFTSFVNTDPPNTLSTLAPKVFNSNEYGKDIPILLHIVCTPNDTTTIQIKRETTSNGQAPIVLVTGPYTAKNEPIIEDQRLDRGKSVMHLDRRTHRGDPPAWLPAFWSKPGIYPLSYESVSIIKMVSSLPFDRNVTSTNTTSAVSVAPASTGMICGGQPFFPGNLQPNVPDGIGIGGNPRNMLMDPMQTLTPVMNSMSPLLQQQQYQRMLQYQQQQLQTMPQLPVTPTASPSSYTQRKPITPPSTTDSITMPCLQFASSLSSPSLAQNRTKKSKAKSKNQSSASSSPSISTPTIPTVPNTASSKAQRKQVKKPMVEKRRVRFMEDQSQVNIFEADANMIDDMDATYPNTYYDMPITTARDGYYYSDDNRDTYGPYHEMEYDLHDYLFNGYYCSKYNDFSDVDQGNDNCPANTVPRTPRSGYQRDLQIIPGRTPIYGDYEDDFGSQVSIADDYDMDCYNNGDELGNNQDYYYAGDMYEKETPRPRTSLDFHMTSYNGSTSPSQHGHHTRRPYSSRLSPSSLSDSIQGPQERQQQPHHSAVARPPPILSTNPRIWQPSRGNYQQ